MSAHLIDLGPVMGQKQTSPSLAEEVRKSSLGEKWIEFTLALCPVRTARVFDVCRHHILISWAEKN